MRAIPMLVLGSSLGLVLGACFTGSATMGAICTIDDQCGIDQTCVNTVCGKCGDGVVQPGELCFGSSSENISFYEVSDLLAFDVNFDGTNELIATINFECEVDGVDMGGPCWDLLLFGMDEDGDLESARFYDANLPGQIVNTAIGNFDGDGIPDLATALIPFNAVDTSQLFVLPNFPSAGTSTDIDVSVFAHSLQAGDLDGNGLDDLVVGAETANTLVIAPSTGNGFGSEQIVITDYAPRLAKPVDMDGDGDLDLVIGSGIWGTIGVDLNDGDANFTPQTRVEIGPDLAVTAITTADFDGDGNLDVVATAAPVVDAVVPVVAVFRGLGNGQLERAATMAGGELPVDVLVEDFNFDGRPDIMVADLFEDKLPIHLNRWGLAVQGLETDEGGFPDRVRIDVAATPATLLRANLNFGDDDDGIPDLVIGNANGVVSLVRSEN